MTNLSISFHTLGCKLNQLETESIAQNFKAQGFAVHPWGAPADLYVLNSCTVTTMAEQKARREIRRVLRERPHACLLVTGCYAQLDPETVRETADLADRARMFVVSGDLKSSLIDLPAAISDSSCSSAELPGLLRQWSSDASSLTSPRPEDRFRFDANDFSFHSRAFLKIQDGCDNVCAYCRVRLARGRGVSLASSEVLKRLRDLEARGYVEAVLTGINLSRYRDDSGADFPDLVRFLLDGTERIALRFSSTEPDGVDERFASVVADPRVRPHFHLSVQSGSDSVLRAMRRRYTSSKVEAAAAMLRAAKGDPFLACDIIAGFPGETDEDFAATYALCERIGFAWIHAFPYSPRPGTDAASFSGRVPEREAVRRVESLMSLARSGRAAYIQRSIGAEVSAVAENLAGGNRLSPGRVPALSENYLRLSVSVGVDSQVPSPGRGIRCRIVSPLDADSQFDADADLL